MKANRILLFLLAMSATLSLGAQNRTVKERSQTVLQGDQGVGYKARYEATWGFRPYPQTEISLSNGVLKQKDGWDATSALYTSWK